MGNLKQITKLKLRKLEIKGKRGRENTLTQLFKLEVHRQVRGLWDARNLLILGPGNSC